MKGIFDFLKYIVSQIDEILKMTLFVYNAIWYSVFYCEFGQMIQILLFKTLSVPQAEFERKYPAFQMFVLNSATFNFT